MYQSRSDMRGWDSRGGDSHDSLQAESAHCAITAGFWTVNRSCVSVSPFATERNGLHTIFPERAFAMASSIRTSFDFAIEPIALPTHARSSAAPRFASSLSGRVSFSMTNATIASPNASAGRPTPAASATSGQPARGLDFHRAHPVSRHVQHICRSGAAVRGVVGVLKMSASAVASSTSRRN
jgi:hypothetical protein